MKTLLLAGGILFLLLGLLLVLAAVVAFAIARNKAVKAAGPQPRPGQQPSPPPPVRPQAPAPSPAAPPAPSPTARAAAPPPPPAPSAAPLVDTDATAVATKLGLGALHGLTGVVKGQTFPIEMDGFFIGRDRTLSQVVLEDPSVSKRHVWVGVRDGAVMAVDQSSTNGTYLNTIGTRISQVRLSPGDTIIISDDAARLVYKV